MHCVVQLALLASVPLAFALPKHNALPVLPQGLGDADHMAAARAGNGERVFSHAIRHRVDAAKRNSSLDAHAVAAMSKIQIGPFKFDSEKGFTISSKLKVSIKAGPFSAGVGLGDLKTGDLHLQLQAAVNLDFKSKGNSWLQFLRNFFVDDPSLGVKHDYSGMQEPLELLAAFGNKICQATKIGMFCAANQQVQKIESMAKGVSKNAKEGLRMLGGVVDFLGKKETQAVIANGTSSVLQTVENPMEDAAEGVGQGEAAYEGSLSFQIASVGAETKLKTGIVPDQDGFHMAGFTNHLGLGIGFDFGYFSGVKFDNWDDKTKKETGARNYVVAIKVKMAFPTWSFKYIQRYANNKAAFEKKTLKADIKQKEQCAQELSDFLVAKTPAFRKQLVDDLAYNGLLVGGDTHRAKEAWQAAGVTFPCTEHVVAVVEEACAVCPNAKVPPSEDCPSTASEDLLKVMSSRYGSKEFRQEWCHTRTEVLDRLLDRNMDDKKIELLDEWYDSLEKNECMAPLLKTVKWCKKTPKAGPTWSNEDGMDSHEPCAESWKKKFAAREKANGQGKVDYFTFAHDSGVTLHDLKTDHPLHDIRWEDTKDFFGYRYTHSDEINGVWEELRKAYDCYT